MREIQRFLPESMFPGPALVNAHRQPVIDMSLETRDPLLSRQTATTQKKHDRGWGRRGMRYPACEKLEIIHLVEQSHLPVRRY
jgi:hypothetical protein